MRADLHMHSFCSDGTLSPAELARRVSASGVRLFSLTDHDNLSGAEEAARAAKALGLRFVRGMEISSYLGATKVHVLGYGCQAGKAYDGFIRARVEGAKVRAADAIRKANEYFSLNVTMEEVEAYHVRKEAPLHTMHVVRAYAARLYADLGRLYRDGFAPAAPAYSDLCRPTPREAVRLVHDMGGLAVLAHPAQIVVLPEEVSARFRFFSEKEKEEAKRAYAVGRQKLMEEIAKEGADGIECYHSTHTAEETEEFLSFAAARGLFVTGGSDFHSDGSSRRIGCPAFDARGVEERLLALDGSV